MSRVYSRHGANIYKTLNKKKRHVISYFLAILFVTLLFVTSNSYARYISSGNAYLAMPVAKWCLEVNGINVTPHTTTINDEINLIVTEGATQDGTVQAGQKGYFDISIDPKYTEVSLSYRINIDTSNLPSNIVLTKYSINDLETKFNMPNNNTFEGQILLNDNLALTNLDEKVYRIYWEWPSSNALVENLQSSYSIIADVEVEQIIQ